MNRVEPRAHRNRCALGSTARRGDTCFGWSRSVPTKVQRHASVQRAQEGCPQGAIGATPRAFQRPAKSPAPRLRAPLCLASRVGWGPVPCGPAGGRPRSVGPGRSAPGVAVSCRRAVGAPLSHTTRSETVFNPRLAMVNADERWSSDQRGRRAAALKVARLVPRRTRRGATVPTFAVSTAGRR